MKETITYKGYMEHNGKIIHYYSDDVSETKHGYQGTIYQYQYINKYPNKTKGWVKTIFKNGKYFGSINDPRIVWKIGKVQLDIKLTISESESLKLKNLFTEMIKENEDSYNKLTSKEKDMIRDVVDTYKHTKGKGMALGGKRDASSYRKLEFTELIYVSNFGISYSVRLTEKGISYFNLKGY